MLFGLNRDCFPILSCLLAIMVVGCTKQPSGLTSGEYRAVLAVPGGDLPIHMRVSASGSGVKAELINGSETVTISEIAHEGDLFTLRIPGYENRLEIRPTDTGYRGDAVMVRPGGNTIRLPLVMTRGQQFRFFPNPAPESASVQGRWAITFTNEPGKVSHAVGEFAQEGNRVTGTILDPTGDHRFLEGEVRGTELFLSRFDGGSAYLYRAVLGADGTLSGRWWSGAWSVEGFTAHRDDHAVLEDPAAARTPERLSFRFPDLDGNAVSLSDSRYQGKVVVVAIGGSWCPNCHDEAAFLLPLYRELHDKGLEIVYLQFEHFGGFADAVAANRRFVAKYSLPWPVLIAGISQRDDAASKLPDLGEIFAFPTTVVVDRRGKVRNVHAGFSGPATGRHYDEFTREFTQRLRGLLDERAP